MAKKQEFKKDENDRIVPYDFVNRPNHYCGTTGKMPLDFIIKHALPYHLAASLKYVIRAGKKPNTPIKRDLGKVRFLMAHFFGNHAKIETKKVVWSNDDIESATSEIAAEFELDTQKIKIVRVILACNTANANMELMAATIMGSLDGMLGRGDVLGLMQTPTDLDGVEKFLHTFDLSTFAHNALVCIARHRFHDDPKQWLRDLEEMRDGYGKQLAKYDAGDKTNTIPITSTVNEHAPAKIVALFTRLKIPKSLVDVASVMVTMEVLPVNAYGSLSVIVGVLSQFIKIRKP